MSDSSAPDSETGRGLSARLRQTLARSKKMLFSGLPAIVRSRRLDAELLSDLEDALIQADIGLSASEDIIAGLRQERYDKDITESELYRLLEEKITARLRPSERICSLEHAGDCTTGPRVALIIGVNGSGKTTLIGKLARRYKQKGKRVVLVAGDTFRAAAVAQLQLWGERAGCPVITGAPGADPAAIAHDAYIRAVADQIDLVLIDTAGRLHNKAVLMDELRKIRRVLNRLDPAVPQETILVLDAVIGQNSLKQAKIFGETVAVTGLVMNKLDGSARGGALIAITEATGLPVYYLGTGEGDDDIEVFSAAPFARALVAADTDSGSS